MTGQFVQHAVPTMLNGNPVMSAIRDREYADLWTVMCLRTEAHAWVGAERYITFRAWWSPICGKYETENGHDGAAHGMTFEQAQRDLLDRAGVRPGRIDERGITDGPYETGWMLIDGKRVIIWVDRPTRDFCRVALCTDAGIGCGDGTLDNRGLTIELPDKWSAEAKVRASAVIASTVFTNENSAEHSPAAAELSTEGNDGE